MKRLCSIGKQVALMAICGLFAISCSTDSDTPEVPEQQFTEEDLELILDSEETTSVVDEILADIYANDSKTGKYAISAKEGEDCYVAEYTASGYTVTFNNCYLNGSDNVNGTLVVTYSQGENSASFSASYEDFYVGEVKINGTKSFSMSGDEEAGMVSISVTSDMVAEFPNGDVITETGTKTITVTAGDTLETTTVTISGDWSVSKNDHVYSVSSDGVTGNFSCEYLVEGEMNINHNGLEVSVDFGDGSCDNKATVTYPNGATQEIELED